MAMSIEQLALSHLADAVQDQTLAVRAAIARLELQGDTNDANQREIIRLLNIAITQSEIIKERIANTQDRLHDEITGQHKLPTRDEEMELLGKVASTGFKILRRMWPLLIAAGGVAVGWLAHLIAWARVHFG